MSRSTFAVVIGVVSAVWHFMVAALLFIIGNVFDEVVEEESASEVKDATVDPEKYAAMKEMISGKFEDNNFGKIFFLNCIYNFFCGRLCYGLLVPWYPCLYFRNNCFCPVGCWGQEGEY